MFEILTLIALVALLIVREVLHYQQVKDLTLKIKAASATEYASIAQTGEPSVELPQEEPISLEDIDPDKALTAMREELKDTVE